MPATKNINIAFLIYLKVFILQRTKESTNYGQLEFIEECAVVQSEVLSGCFLVKTHKMLSVIGQRTKENKFHFPWFSVICTNVLHLQKLPL